MLDKIIVIAQQKGMKIVENNLKCEKIILPI